MVNGDRLRHTRWLVRTDRALVAVFARCLGEAQASLGPEVGEEFRVLESSRPLASADLLGTGLVRFIMPIEAELPTRDLARGDEACLKSLAQAGRVAPAAAAFALRRHGRFAVARLEHWMAARYPSAPTRGEDLLLVAVSEHSTFVGVSPLAATGSPRPGGWTKAPATADALSRAAGKIEEALAWLDATDAAPPPGARWVELGAYPGGMTGALARRGYLVHAVDVHPPSPAMLAFAGVTCHQGDASAFRPPTDVDAILCDVNGPPRVAAEAVIRASAALRPGGWLVHTLKLPDWDHFESLCASVKAMLERAGFGTIQIKHLACNRQEVTLFGRKV